jgi:hypothetical protein
MNDREFSDIEIFQHSGRGIPLFMTGHKNCLQSDYLLGPGPRLIKKEFAGPRSHEGWETLLYTTELFLLFHILRTHRFLVFEHEAPVTEHPSTALTLQPTLSVRAQTRRWNLVWVRRSSQYAPSADKSMRCEAACAGLPVSLWTESRRRHSTSILSRTWRVLG